MKNHTPAASLIKYNNYNNNVENDDGKAQLFLDTNSNHFLCHAMRAAFLDQRRPFQSISNSYQSNEHLEISETEDVNRLSTEALHQMGVYYVRDVTKSPTPICYLTGSSGFEDSDKFKLFSIKDDISSKRKLYVNIVPDYGCPKYADLLKDDVKKADVSAEVCFLLNELKTLLKYRVVVTLTARENDPDHKEYFKMEAMVTARVKVRFYLYAFDRMERVYNAARCHEEFHGLPYGISLLALRIMYHIACTLSTCRTQMKHVYCRCDFLTRAGLIISWKGKTTGDNLRKMVLAKLKSETFLNYNRVLEYQTKLLGYMHKNAWSLILFYQRHCVTFGNIRSFYAQTTPTKEDFDIEEALTLSLNSFKYLTVTARDSLSSGKPVVALPPPPPPSSLPSQLVDADNKQDLEEEPLLSLQPPPKRSLDSLLDAASCSSPSLKRVKLEQDDDDDAESAVYSIVPDFSERYGNQEAFFNDRDIFKTDESDNLMFPVNPLSPANEEDDQGDGVFMFDTDNSSVEEKEENKEKEVKGLEGLVLPPLSPPLVPLPPLPPPPSMAVLDVERYLDTAKSTVNLCDLFNEERYLFDDGSNYNVI